ncbi:MAG: hypothetical protein J0M33_23895 [Anaerolineae bacterium]|nr:hypothetical protein [Anaerolineae bacterium]
MPRPPKKIYIKEPMKQTLFITHETGVFILSATAFSVSILSVDSAGNEVATLILPIRGMVNHQGWYLKGLKRLLERL